MLDPNLTSPLFHAATWNIGYCNASSSGASKDPETEAIIKTIKSVNAMAYGMCLPIICAFGIVGNVLNLITLRSPLLQAVSYMYLRALAIADLCCMVFVLGFVLRMQEVFAPGEFYKEWYQARLELALINGFIAAGVLTVLSLTVERYISVVFPVYFREWNRPRRALIIISAAYVLSVLLHLPMAWERRVCIRPGGSGSGHPVYGQEEDQQVRNTATFIAYKWIRETVGKVIPVLGLAYFNVHIIAAFRRVKQRRAAMICRTNGGGAESRASDDRRLMVLLASIAVLFFVCNLPAALNLLFIKDALKFSIPYQVFRAIANMLEIMNHALNFYIFCMCSKDYRQEFLKTFPCLLRIRSTYLLYRCRVKAQHHFTGSSPPLAIREQTALLAPPKSCHSKSSAADNPTVTTVYCPTPVPRLLDEGFSVERTMVDGENNNLLLPSQYAECT